MSAVLGIAPAQVQETSGVKSFEERFVEEVERRLTTSVKRGDSPPNAIFSVSDGAWMAPHRQAARESLKDLGYTVMAPTEYSLRVERRFSTQELTQHFTQWREEFKKEVVERLTRSADRGDAHVRAYFSPTEQSWLADFLQDQRAVVLADFHAQTHPETKSLIVTKPGQ